MKRFTDADLARILQKQGQPVDFKYRANPKAREGPSESAIQQKLMCWWTNIALANNIPEHLLMAFPLQGYRDARHGARMKREGMRAGTPDMLLAVARGKYHGLFLELKTENGRLTPTQKTMLDDLDAQDYATFACYGAEKAIKLIGDYLRGEEFF